MAYLYGMSLRFQILGSSSSGNCSLLETAETRILIDAGFSGRRIENLLKSVGRRIEEIDAVFLTHEHSDHASGVRGLSRHEHLHYFASYPTAQVIQERLKRQVSWKIFESGARFEYRDLKIEAVKLPHDAHDPVGFIFQVGGQDMFNPAHSVAWLTDMGYVPDYLPEKLRHTNVLVLEANHDLELLESDMRRPFAVKQRIRGRHGHLSNHAVRDFLQTHSSPYWRKIYLAHISRDCNCLDRVTQTFCEGQFPWLIEVVNPEAGPTELLDLASLG